MAFNERLKEARINAGLTQEQLAEKLGMGKSTIAGYEKGNREPSMYTIKNIMDILNIDANFLWQDEMNDSLELIVSSYEWNIIKKYRKLDVHGKDLIDTILLKEHNRCVKEPTIKYETVLKPCYESSLSAGTGSFVFDDVPSKQIEVPIDFKDIDFVISVRGDSMEPSFFDGERVMIKKQHEISSGEVGAFMVNGEAFIKELSDNCLVSHNKKYAPIQFNESMRIVCIGKVIGKLQ